jgi:hypothetical protein
MKIIEHTSAKLTFKDSALWILLLGLIFLIVAVTTLAGAADLFLNLKKLSVFGLIIVLIFALSGLVTGLLIIHIHPLVYVRFNKILWLLTVHRRGFMKNETETYGLKEIGAIEIKESEDSEGDLFYRIVVKLKNGKQVLLSAMGEFNRESLQENTETIRSFLKISC